MSKVERPHLHLLLMAQAYVLATVTVPLELQIFCALLPFPTCFASHAVFKWKRAA